MAKPGEYALNRVFLKNRMTELGVKQWWLAEQVGVDRKTVTRWLQGQVKSIQSDNLDSLATVLECTVEALILENVADQLASTDDQKAAAKLLAASSVVDKLGPIGEWEVVAALLKATLVSELPLSILGELYNQLTIATWRQSKLDEATVYNQKALEIANRSGDKAVLAGALLSAGNLLSWRGQSREAIATYRACLDLEAFIDPRMLGSVYSNLGALLYELGDLDAGQSYQHKALEAFAIHGTAMNHSIAWSHLALIALERDDVQDAREACERSLEFAARDDYRRGLCFGELLRADIHAREGDREGALAALKSGARGYVDLGIEEGLNFRIEGRVYRVLGEMDASVESLKKALVLSRSFPLEHATSCLELARSFARMNVKEAKVYAKKALKGFKMCEAPLLAERAERFLKTIA